MLTEVSYCITTYLCVLIIEYLPSIIENRGLQKFREMRLTAHNFHEFMFIFASVGVFLSFFHQGLPGRHVRPFSLPGPLPSARASSSWPWTFFLFIWSAAAAGPGFTVLIISLTEKISGRKLVPFSVKQFYGKISGWMLITYMAAKTIDTLVWANSTLPRLGVQFSDLYAAGPYGSWLLWLELGLCGWLPGRPADVAPGPGQSQVAVADVFPDSGGRGPQSFCRGYFVPWPSRSRPLRSSSGTCLPGRRPRLACGMLGFGVLVYGLSYRYLPLFPKERELNAA